MSFKVQREVKVFRVRLYCDPPCDEELKAIDGTRGIIERWRHVCKNGHEEILEEEKYPRLEYLEILLDS